MNMKLLARWTTESGILIEAFTEYDEQYGDYIGFVRLFGNYVPFGAGQAYKEPIYARQFAMRQFSKYTAVRA